MASGSDEYHVFLYPKYSTSRRRLPSNGIERTERRTAANLDLHFGGRLPGGGPRLSAMMVYHYSPGVSFATVQTGARAARTLNTGTIIVPVFRH